MMVSVCPISVTTKTYKQQMILKNNNFFHFILCLFAFLIKNRVLFFVAPAMCRIPYSSHLSHPREIHFSYVFQGLRIFSLEKILFVTHYSSHPKSHNSCNFCNSGQKIVMRAKSRGVAMHRHGDKL